MSQLSRSDVKNLALCLHEDPTLHDADHDKIRSLINNIPCHLRGCKLANIICEPRHDVKPCLIHEGIASLVVSYLFTSLKKQVDDSVPLLKKYGPYLGPEEIYMLEKTITIEGMWSPPTARTDPPKMRYWDYQVNKCQACMIARIASDPSALRDMRTLMLAAVDSSAKSTDPRLLPNHHPTALTFVNEWISLSPRSDELFYFSGMQAASIKAVTLKFEEVTTAPSRCSGNTNFSYPRPRPDYTSSRSSCQSTAVWTTPSHTPGSSTSSTYSSASGWEVLTRCPKSSSTATQQFTRGRGYSRGFSISSRSSSIPAFLPFQGPIPTASIGASDASLSLHSTYSASPPQFGVDGFVEVERDTSTPRPSSNQQDDPSRQKPFMGSRFAKPLPPTSSDRASFTSFILRDSPVASDLPPLALRRTTPSRIVRPFPQHEDSGIGLSDSTRFSSQDTSSWTLVDWDTSYDSGEHSSQQHGLQGQKRSAETSTVDLFQGQQQQDQGDDGDGVPLISRWSTTSSGNKLSNLLKKTSFGPRLGKVKTGRAVLKSDADKDDMNSMNKKKSMS